MDSCDNKNDNTLASNYSLSNSNNLVYAIYTSGTTGLPKAAVIEHHSFVNLIYWYTKKFNLTAKDKFLIVSEICFDLTQKNYFSSLILGGTIYLADFGSFDARCISQLILKNGITRINCAPSAFELIMFALRTYSKEDYTLDHVFLGGESISENLLKKIKSAKITKFIVNTYGPTECTDISTYYAASLQELDYTRIFTAINST